ncbi:MAG: response regulator transcription factor [Candidatus Obscuribacterales bacterium]|nr:response regulator transcription factor [Candidatus Obscuribacterales bacterium]
MPKVLLVEDDTAVANELTKVLRTGAYAVDHCATGADALSYISEYAYDLIVLDWELPDCEGPTLCARFRRSCPGVRILMLTGRSATKDRVSGLDAGADDYLTKPFSGEELRARARALLRRGIDNNRSSVLGPLVLSEEKHSATYNGIDLDLSKREMALLLLMSKFPNEFLSTRFIYESLWRDNPDVGESLVRTYVSRLRKKFALHSAEKLIETSVNYGYAFHPPDGCTE